MSSHTIFDLLAEYERALGYTDLLWLDLSADELLWRPSENSSAIAWHLGHQAAVAHYMVRNLTAAERQIDPEIDAVMDSATEEPVRGQLPSVERLTAYRQTVVERVRFRIGNIDAGNVGAPAQLRMIATTMLTAIVNHEYQHSKWIGEVRLGAHGKPLPAAPVSDILTVVDGYNVVTV
jgi:hypothetical protein